jgi:hypothetical protein
VIIATCTLLHMASLSSSTQFKTLSCTTFSYQYETGLAEYDSAVDHMATPPEAVCGNFHKAWIESHDRLILTTGTLSSFPGLPHARLKGYPDRRTCQGSEAEECREALLSSCSSQVRGAISAEAVRNSSQYGLAARRVSSRCLVTNKPHILTHGLHARIIPFLTRSNDDHSPIEGDDLHRIHRPVHKRGPQMVRSGGRARGPMVARGRDDVAVRLLMQVRGVDRMCAIL